MEGAGRFQHGFPTSAAAGSFTYLCVSLVELPVLEFFMSRLALAYDDQFVPACPGLPLFKNRGSRVLGPPWSQANWTGPSRMMGDTRECREPARSGAVFLSTC